MSPEKQRTAIAEACGWTYCSGLYGVKPFDPFESVKPQTGPTAYTHRIPDYLNDLNAMHKAEKTLRDSPGSYQPGGRRHYLSRLACMFTDHPDDGMTQAVCATAAQRAEAFLRCLNLWEEEE